MLCNLVLAAAHLDEHDVGHHPQWAYYRRQLSEGATADCQHEGNTTSRRRLDCTIPLAVVVVPSYDSNVSLENGFSCPGHVGRWRLQGSVHWGICLSLSSC